MSKQIDRKYNALPKELPAYMKKGFKDGSLTDKEVDKLRDTKAMDFQKAYHSLINNDDFMAKGAQADKLRADLKAKVKAAKAQQKDPNAINGTELKGAVKTAKTANIDTNGDGFIDGKEK